MIVWKNTINHNIHIVNTNSNRICSIIVHIDKNVSILLINVYMPCDDRMRGDNYDTLCSILEEIRNICENNYSTHVIFGGDFNIDFKRNTYHSNELTYFIEREELCKCLDAPFSNIDFTFSSSGTGYRSLIDHFFVTEALFNSLSHHYTIDSIDNVSDHCALLCSFKLNIKYCVRAEINSNERVKWQKATENDLQEYRKQLDINLKNIVLPNDLLTCEDLFCSDHHDVINNFYNDIVEACQDASSKYIPCSKNSNGRNKKIAGWVEEVEDKRQISLFWHFIWKECGSPRTGIVGNIARRTRASYHYAIRCAIKKQNKIRSHKMAEAIATDMTRDFWREVKKIKNCNKLKI